MELRLQARNINSHTSDNPTFVSTQLKGLKKQHSLKRQKQLKSWVKLQVKKRKRALTRVSCSTPPIYEPPQTLENQFSFTNFFMLISLVFEKMSCSTFFFFFWLVMMLTFLCYDVGSP